MWRWFRSLVLRKTKKIKKPYYHDTSGLLDICILPPILLPPALGRNINAKIFDRLRRAEFFSKKKDSHGPSRGDGLVYPRPPIHLVPQLGRTETCPVPRFHGIRTPPARTAGGTHRRQADERREPRLTEGRVRGEAADKKMGSALLPTLRLKREVDAAIRDTLDKVLVLRFGRTADAACLHLDDIVSTPPSPSRRSTPS
jgi:hypothetical protein